MTAQHILKITVLLWHSSSKYSLCQNVAAHSNLRQARPSTQFLYSLVHCSMASPSSLIIIILFSFTCHQNSEVCMRNVWIMTGMLRWFLVLAQLLRCIKTLYSFVFAFAFQARKVLACKTSSSLISIWCILMNFPNLKNLWGCGWVASHMGLCVLLFISKNRLIL